jgi:hypothetical protein
MKRTPIKTDAPIPLTVTDRGSAYLDAYALGVAMAGSNLRIAGAWAAGFEAGLRAALEASKVGQ